MTKLLKNITAATLAAVLFVLSPGLPAYQLFAQVVAHPVPTGMSMPATPVVNAVLPNAGNAVSNGQILKNGVLPTLSVLPTVRVQAVSAQAAALPTVQAAKNSAASAVVKTAVPSMVRTSVLEAGQSASRTAREENGQRAAAAQVGTMAVEVGKTLSAAGELSSVSAENSRGVGSKIQAILTGARFNAAEDLPFEPAVEIRDVRRGFELAKPAGQELAETVGAYNIQEVVPTPAEQTERPLPPSNRNSPTWPKFLAAGLALLPAALLGWPLIAAAGGTLGLALGSATIASSVLLAALPFMGAGTRKGVRMIPGIGLTVLGLTAAFGAFTLGTGYAAAALVALGGWGLVRYGKSEDSRRGYDNEYALSAFFGALGATALPALVLMPHAGIVATVLIVGSYLSAGLLLMHLPSWVGFGITSVMTVLYKGTRGILRVEDSLRNDTVLYDRLVRFTKDQLSRSPWNAVWLAGIWVPVGLSELVQWALGVAGGVVVGAMGAPAAFLWGASYKLSRESRATRFFAEWTRSMFDNVQGGKKAHYNPLIKPLLTYVNSKNKLVSLPASLALRLAQWGWLLYAVLGTPVLGLVGFVRAFGRSAAPYAEERHNPNTLRVDTDDRAGENTDEPGPTDPTKPGKSTLAPRIIATTLALLPAGFFGLPMLFTMSPAFGGFYLALTLALAALPFLPAATPKKARQLPGILLSTMGLMTLAGLYMLFTAAPVVALAGPAVLKAAQSIVTTNGFWMGSLGTVGGWGLYRYLGRISEEDGKRISPDDPEYIGAFFGATAAAAGLGAILMGLTGWPLVVLSGLAYLTSPLLLMHLPKWVWTGLSDAFYGVVDSARGFYKILNAWERETDFHRNLRKHANYWLGKTVWNGSWLSILWVPMWLTQLAEFALAGVLGLALGAVRAPFNFAAGAFRKGMPGSKLDRFFSAFTESWLAQSEGRDAYAQFERSGKRWLEGMNAYAEPSHRPTLGAVLSGLAVRLDQVVWLLGTLLATPVLMAYGVYKGFKAAFAKPTDGDGSAPVETQPSEPVQLKAKSPEQRLAPLILGLGGAIVMLGLPATSLAIGVVLAILTLPDLLSGSQTRRADLTRKFGAYALGTLIGGIGSLLFLHGAPLVIAGAVAVPVAWAALSAALSRKAEIAERLRSAHRTDSRGTLSGFAAPGLVALGLFLGKAVLGFGAGVALTALLYKLGVFKQGGGDISGPAGLFFTYIGMGALGAALATVALPFVHWVAALGLSGLAVAVGGGVLGLAAGLALTALLYKVGALKQSGGDISGPAGVAFMYMLLAALGAGLGAYLLPLLI
ncbi:MAG: hypothetical protein WC969_11800 [Elusimicrobiota bacterium]|jgi:hypothetical protein